MRLLSIQPTIACLALLAFAPMTFAQDAAKAEEKPKAEEKKAEEKPADKPADKPAEKPADKPAESAAKQVVQHLDNPSGVTVHPGTGHVFVTSRQGVFRYVPATNKIYLEVEGFPTDEYGK